MLRSSIRIFTLSVLLSLVPLFASGTADAAGYSGVLKVRVAAASSLREVMPELLGAYHEAGGAAEIEVIFGSSGKLYAQIVSGAPYDLYLAANERYPARLVEEGYGAGLPELYYSGTLVCVSGLDDFPSGEDFSALQNWMEHTSGMIAIANPQTAPYGEAYKRLSEKCPEYFPGVDTSRIITAGSVSQALHFALSGAACAFVSRSLLNAELKRKVGVLVIDEEYSGSIPQHGLLLKNGERNPEARHFWDFLLSLSGQEIFARAEE
ncbi:molybdate ABC transporter substrate-binding protein [Marispirochaeta sp.]|jgi:molybdate transport system substrate-binding protein|uniref:molybdate ABC transporter substrate-binding protein n=1 Tax=Marispirochaeta sp. TaxID=2038653 RepID=UPI0029C867FC|nr:molybdate ABC transporter substrate-binding protein [Marispirochaeta sp.]